MHIDDIQKLVGAPTPGEAVKKVQAMVEGFSPNDPPDTYREVLVLNGDRMEIAIYDHGAWIGHLRLGSPPVYCDVRAWWELPGVFGVGFEVKLG